MPGVILGILTLALPAASWAQVGEDRPAAVCVALRSLQSALHDVEGFPALKERFEKSPFARPLKLVNQERPWGLLVFLREDRFPVPGIVVSIPVDDMPALAAGLKLQPLASLRPGAGGTSQGSRDGELWTLQFATQRIEGRYLGQTLFFASHADELPSVEMTQAVLPAVLGESDLAVQLRRDGIPLAWQEWLRELALGRYVDPQSRAADMRRAAETAPAGTNPVPDGWEHVFDGSESILARAKIDGQLLLTVDWVARAGSPLAADFAGLQLKTGHLPDLTLHAALMVRGSASVPQWMRDLLSVKLKELQVAARAQLQQHNLHLDGSDVTQLFGALQASIDEGQIQAALAFLPEASGRMTYLSVMRVAQPEQLAAALSMLVPSLAEQSRVQGLEGHVLQRPGMIFRLPPGKLGKREAQLYGSGCAAYFGVIENWVTFTLGERECEQRLEALQPVTVADPALLEARWSLRPWLGVLAKDSQQRLIQHFPAEENDTLELAVTAQADRLTCQLRAQPGYLRLLADSLSGAPRGVRRK